MRSLHERFSMCEVQEHVDTVSNWEHLLDRLKSTTRVRCNEDCCSSSSRRQCRGFTFRTHLQLQKRLTLDCWWCPCLVCSINLSDQCEGIESEDATSRALRGGHPYNKVGITHVQNAAWFKSESAVVLCGEQKEECPSMSTDSQGGPIRILKVILVPCLHRDLYLMISLVPPLRAAFLSITLKQPNVWSVNCLSTVLLVPCFHWCICCRLLSNCRLGLNLYWMEPPDKHQCNY